MNSKFWLLLIAVLMPFPSFAVDPLITHANITPNSAGTAARIDVYGENFTDPFTVELRGALVPAVRPDEDPITPGDQPSTTHFYIDNIALASIAPDSSLYLTVSNGTQSNDFVVFIADGLLDTSAGACPCDTVWDTNGVDSTNTDINPSSITCDISALSGGGESIALRYQLISNGHSIAADAQWIERRSTQNMCEYLDFTEPTASQQTYRNNSDYQNCKYSLINRVPGIICEYHPL